MTDVIRFSGAFLVWKLNSQGFRRDVGGTRLPHHRHQTIDAAITEAERLNGLYPASTFVVIQEVARVKAATPVSSRSQGDGHGE